MDVIVPTTQDILGDNGWLKEDKIGYVENLLLSTHREGMDKVISFMKNTDFYIAPASTIYHSNYKGGLLDHSLCVYSLSMYYKNAMVTMNPDIEEKLPTESIIISSILHDICKTSFYQQQLKWKKDDSGNWFNYDGYKVVDLMPCGHGEKSVIMLQYLGFQLTLDEILAIRWHMGMFNDGGGNSDLKYSQIAAIKMSPLVSVIQMADMTGSLIFEKEINYDNN